MFKNPLLDVYWSIDNNTTIISYHFLLYLKKKNNVKCLKCHNIKNQLNRNT